MKQYLELSKFADPTRASKDEDRSTRDGFMIRIAEMYLIAAEAGAKANKADALDYMNKLRMTRAISGYEDAMRVELSQIQDIDFILDERARELAGEQLRWFDLKRFGKEQFVKRIKKCNPDAANVDEHHWVRPFPQTFLDAIEIKRNLLKIQVINNEEIYYSFLLGGNERRISFCSRLCFKSMGVRPR